MEVVGEYTFEAPQDTVWRALQDPNVLASVMPGGEDFKEIGENEYSGILNIRVGPVQGKFAGSIKLSEIVEPTSYKMTVDGKGSPGFVKADGQLQLTGQGESTQMTYEGTAQVGGRIASVGQRLLDSSAKSIIRQSLDGLNEYLKLQVTQSASSPADSGGEEIDAQSPAKTADYKPPSQTTVAVNVARDVAGDLIQPRYVAGALILIVLIVVLILLLT